MLSKEEIEHIALLARLSLTEKEKELFGTQLSSILDYMEQLGGLDTSDVDPLSHVIELSNVFRNDELKPGLTREEALRNAPQRSEKFFKVPKVLGDR